MATRMLTLKLDPSEATLSQVRGKLDLREDEVDPNFGVVNVSPEQNLYVILVDDKVADKLEGHKALSGSFSNPQIEPFGPPESSNKKAKR